MVLYKNVKFIIYDCVEFLLFSLVVVGAGLFSNCVMQASHCSGFSCCRAQALGCPGFIVVAPGFSSGGL